MMVAQIRKVAANIPLRAMVILVALIAIVILAMVILAALIIYSSTKILDIISQCIFVI